MDSMIQPVKLAGWYPARIPPPIPWLGQAATSTTPMVSTPPRSGLIESPLFNVTFDLLGVFAAGALAVGSLATERRSGSVTPLSMRPAMGASDKKKLFKGAGWAITFGVVSLVLLAKAGYEISKA